MTKNFNIVEKRQGPISCIKTAQCSMNDITCNSHYTQHMKYLGRIANIRGSHNWTMTPLATITDCSSGPGTVRLVHIMYLTVCIFEFYD